MEDLKSSDRTIGSCKRTLPNNAYIVHVDLRYTSGVRVIDPGKVNSPLEPKVNSLSHPAILILTPNTKTPSIKKRGSSFSLSLSLSFSRSLDTSTLPAHKNSSSDPERASLIQNYRHNSNRRWNKTNENKLTLLLLLLLLLLFVDRLSAGRPQTLGLRYDRPKNPTVSSNEKLRPWIRWIRHSRCSFCE